MECVFRLKRQLTRYSGKISQLREIRVRTVSWYQLEMNFRSVGTQNLSYIINLSQLGNLLYKRSLCDFSIAILGLWRWPMLRSAVGITHVLQSRLVVGYTTAHKTTVEARGRESLEACVTTLLPLGDCHNLFNQFSATIWPWSLFHEIWSTRCPNFSELGTLVTKFQKKIQGQKVALNWSNRWLQWENYIASSYRLLTDCQADLDSLCSLDFGFPLIGNSSPMVPFQFLVLPHFRDGTPSTYKTSFF